MLAVLLIKSLEQTHETQIDHNPLKIYLFYSLKRQSPYNNTKVSFTLDEVYTFIKYFLLSGVKMLLSLCKELFYDWRSPDRDYSLLACDLFKLRK